MSAREIMLTELPCNIVYGREQAVDDIIAALHASGFRILGKDEVDPVTVERAARAMCDAVDENWDAASHLETANGNDPEEQRDYWRALARAALEAAAKAGG